ncbi:hypothetical protein HNQ77_000015 [Silvibacterium bohemicum]|uniref:DUF3891 domain-containing protein n=1 Tax=Silvibacterium bohemicum TaxID=1577686 RepID=A0A841JNA1_9BACT|nr:DUF3891 family protein [Silvibacterium bohemicum]MBB6142077.1 hypothetical protein [Silvibacterium bohemicum]
MLRLETENGWWLVTHVDHARLAGAFAAKWGNDLFRAPEPRAHVLEGIARHDDGWRGRDANPKITRAGKPSAFSVELVGKYSAFEEIDLPDYLAVREAAVRLIAEEDAYAATLVSMHTYNLLTERADRSTIASAELPLLDSFLTRQKELQQMLRRRIAEDKSLSSEEKSEARIIDHFRLLQAVDNLSLLTCVDYREPATLLHPLPLCTGGHAEIKVQPQGERSFRLMPYPFEASPVRLTFPARHIEGEVFASAEELQERYLAAPLQMLTVSLFG